MPKPAIALGTHLRCERTSVNAFALVCVSQGNDIQITRHPMAVDGNGRSRLKPGSPLTIGALDKYLKMLRGFSEKEASELTWRNPKVLATGAGKICWHTPPAIRPMYFLMRGARNLSAVPWPGLIFVATEGTLKIAAYKGDATPTPETPLYHAPVMNIYADGGVCLGSATRPRGDGEKTIPVWEEAIFKTNFTHVNQDFTLSTGKRKRAVSNVGHFRFWASLAKKGISDFPVEKLVPMNITLKDFVHD